MTPDPQLAFTVALAMAFGWTMLHTGVRKHMLELKQRKRICPSCGRSIQGRVCQAH
jgi:hypothetical protein